MNWLIQLDCSDERTGTNEAGGLADGFGAVKKSVGIHNLSSTGETLSSDGATLNDYIVIISAVTGNIGDLFISEDFFARVSKKRPSTRTPKVRSESAHVSNNRGLRFLALVGAVMLLLPIMLLSRLPVPLAVREPEAMFLRQTVLLVMSTIFMHLQPAWSNRMVLLALVTTASATSLAEDLVSDDEFSTALKAAINTGTLGVLSTEPEAANVNTAAIGYSSSRPKRATRAPDIHTYDSGSFTGGPSELRGLHTKKKTAEVTAEHAKNTKKAEAERVHLAESRIDQRHWLVPPKFARVFLL